MRPRSDIEAKISVEYLRSRFSYDAETGVLTYLRQPRCEFNSDRSWKRWNTIFAGKEAGWFSGKYRCVEIKGRNFYCQRVIWALVTGSWPELFIDHLDRDRVNNRWSNLSEVTKSENGVNREYVPHGDTPSGTKGVCYRKATGRYEAYSIGHPGSKRRYLGSSKDVTEAAALVLADLKERGLEHLST